MKKKNSLSIIFLDFDDIKNPLLGAGQAKATFEVGSRLVKNGHKVTVISSRYPSYKDRTQSGIIYKHIGVGSTHIKLNNLIYILALPFMVRKVQADIIVECFTAPISTMLSPLFTKIPVVGLPTSFEAERFAKLYNLPFDRVEHFGLKRYKYFLPYTEHFDKKIKKVNKNAVTKIVPEGVGREYFRIKQQKPKHILYLGRLDIGQKGLDLLLVAYAKVANKIKYPLVLAGHGPDEIKVKDLIKKNKLEKKVILVGAVYGTKKEQLLSEAVFAAFPSRHEGFSLVSLEVLAAGLPIVGFNIPALSFADKTISFKAKRFSVSEYANLLLKATDTKTIIPMRKNARLYVKKYTWENVAIQFESFFRQVLKLEKGK